MINLFGEEVAMPEEHKPDNTKIGKFAARTNYRKSKGYSKCKNCQHCIIKRWNMKSFYKCENLGDSNSTATDIRANYVCDLHELEG